MINEQATYDKFGYWSEDLAQFSTKLVIATCESCGQDREVKKKVGAKSKVCIKCQRVNQARIIARQNRFGRKHSEETKIKMRASSAKLWVSGKRGSNFGKKFSDEHKRRIGDANRKRVWTEESKAKASAAKKGKKPSKETREIWSKQRRGLGNHRYGKPAAHGKGQWYIRKNGDRIWLRSTWEHKTAMYLDSNNLEWEYEPCAFPVAFVYEGEAKEGTYRPDFKVKINNEEEIWEVKGHWRDDAKAKFDAFIEQYPECSVRLLNEAALQEKGIL